MFSSIRGQTVIYTDPGVTHTNSDGPTGPDIFSVDVSSCSSFNASLDFSFSLPWEGSGNMEIADDCGIGTCAGDPSMPTLDGCSGCWDFLWVRFLLDGVEVGSDLIGETGTTDADQMGSISISNICTDGANTLEISIVTQTWASDESVTISNIEVECWQGAPIISTNDPLCEGDVLNLVGSAVDESIITSWMWTNSGAGVIANPSNQTTTATGAENGETYTLNTTDVNLCITPNSVNVVVNPELPSNFAQLGPYCVGDVPDPLLTTSDNGVDGTWNGPITTTSTGTTRYNFTIDPGECARDTFMEILVEDCTCDLIDAGLALVDCDPNSTLDDSSDDIIFFLLNPMGDFLGATYNVSVSSGSISPTTGVYGNPTGFQLQSGSAGGGNVTVTITDVSGAPCTIDIVITDPGSCSTECNLMDGGLTNTLCADSGTPGMDTDDIITFDLDPTGFNLTGTYSVTVSGGSISPLTGTYGGSTSFQLQPGSAGNGDITVTITDDNDASCSIMVLVLDPGTCSNSCNISDILYNGSICFDNGTDSDDTDDVITFDIQPIGTGIGTSYNVFVDFGIISPLSGNYGSFQTFSLQPGSAGLGAVTLTVEDADDPGCFFQIQILDPGTCSNACSLTDGGISGLTCNDNGTSGDITDDRIFFNLDPIGLNLGTTYSVSVSSGTITPASAAYGSATAFQLQAGSAGAGNITLTITDESGGSCFITVPIADPGPCSNTCNLTTLNVTAPTCNDNGTTSDPSDDFISFDLDPGGNILSATYNVSVSSGTISPTSGTYGPSSPFQLQAGSAGAGNVTVTVTDASGPPCTIDVTIIDPGSCSNTCNLVAADLTAVICNDNSTDTNTSDDFISFSLNPSGGSLGASYSVTVSSGTVSPLTGNYGAPTSFQLQPGSAGAGNVTITITDVSSALCVINVPIVDPGSCSSTCNLTAADLMAVICNDNGTDTNTADDFISFNLNPSGANLGVSYSVTVSSGSVSPTTGNYGSPTSFQLQTGSAGAGNVTITITDVSGALCMINVPIVDPGSCSSICNLTMANLTTISCDDNGSDSNNADDFISFELNPVGTNLGASYTVAVASGTISPMVGNYGSATSFQLQAGSAGAGNVTVTITDVSGDCMIDIPIADPGNCSNPCSIGTLILPVSQCDDAGTPGDLTDDFFTFTINLSGTNTAPNFILGGDLTGTYAYGITHPFGPFLISGGDIMLTFTDENTSTCMDQITVMPPDCNCPTVNAPVGMNDTICEFEPIPTLSVTVDPGLQANWYDMAIGGTLLVSNSTTYSPAAAGTYFVEAFDPATMCSSSRTPIQLVVHPLPNGSINAVCDPATPTYHIDVMTTVDSVRSTLGLVVMNGAGSYSVNGIPENMGTSVVMHNRMTGCEFIALVPAPDCSCPPVNAPVGRDTAYCTDDLIPVLEVSVDVGLIAVWFDAAMSGTELATNTTTYNPTGPGIYYVESQIPGTGCVSIRTPITVTTNLNPTLALIDQVCNEALGTYDLIFSTNADMVNPTVGNLQNNMDGTYNLTDIPLSTSTVIDVIFIGTGCDTTYNIAAATCCPLESPAISISIPENLHCNQPDVLLDGSNSEIGADILYQWYDENFVPISGANSAVLTVSDTGSYYLESMDVSEGCTNIDTVMVSESVLDTFDLSAQLMNCSDEGATLVVDNIIGNSSPYQFSIDNGAFMDDNIFDGVMSGRHIVRVRDFNGCIVEDSIDIVNNNSFTIDLGIDQTINLGDSVRLMVNTNQTDLIYNWNPSPNLSCLDCSNPWASPDQTEVFTMTAMDINGCEETVSIRVIVNTNVDVYIPTAFTPNADGTNDRFAIFGSDQIREIKSMTIYNRWGDQVFNRLRLSPNDEAQGWDGLFKGNEAPVGVYMYALEIELVNGRLVSYEGDITLLR